MPAVFDPSSSSISYYIMYNYSKELFYFQPSIICVKAPASYHKKPHMDASPFRSLDSPVICTTEPKTTKCETHTNKAVIWMAFHSHPFFAVCGQRDGSFSMSDLCIFIQTDDTISHIYSLLYM